MYYNIRSGKIFVHNFCMEIGEMKGSVRIAMFRFIFDQKPRVNANSVLMENFGKEIS